MAYPNTGIYPQSFTFRDAKGRTGIIRGFLNLGGGTTMEDPADRALTILNTIAAAGTAGTLLTNAARQAAHGPHGEVGVPQYGLGGKANEYGDIRQKAIFVFGDALGRFHRYAIPAPKSAIFLADGVTVDPTNAQVEAFVAAMLGNTNGAFWSDQFGNALTGFSGGYFQDRKSRRASVLRLTPQLTASLPGDE